MFSSIRTSELNRDAISELTNKLALGKENVIARIALGYSLAQDTKLNLLEIKDSKGKEYSRKVLFGEQAPIYIALICQRYQFSKANPDLGKYIKLHLDHGLKLLSERLQNNNIDGLEMVIGMIQKSLM